MSGRNIVLIGMPGAGKSTIGVLLAKTLGMPFTDTDLIIQQREGRLLQDIINKDGIEKFLAIEEAVILGLNVKEHIVATGGSAVYSDAAVGRLKKDGILVYLQLEFEDIEKRIKNITSRGIAMSQGQSLAELYVERVPLYEKFANVTISCTGKHTEDIVAQIKVVYQDFVLNT